MILDAQNLHTFSQCCQTLGLQIYKCTTAHHPPCDGMVECFNRTLRSMLRKHAATFGLQGDKYLSGVL